MKAPTITKVPHPTCQQTGLTGDLSSLQQYQRCYYTGNGWVLLHGWTKPPELAADGSVAIPEKLITGLIIQSNDINIPVNTQLEALDMSAWIPSTQCCSTGEGGESTINPLISTKCYLETIPAEIDVYQTSATSALGSNAVTGRGYALRKIWTTAQFPNEGDGGGGIESFHSLVTTDINGLPTVNGEYAETNVNTITSSVNGANGDLITWEAFIINPNKWNKKAVGTIRINDSYAAINHSDRDEIWVGVLPGTTDPSVDRDHMVKVSEGQSGISYTLPSTWQDKWTRLFVVNSNKSGAAQINLTVDVLAPDGSVLAANQPISRFIWHPANPDRLPLFSDTQRVITRIVDGNTGNETWKAGGIEVSRENLHDPLCPVPCDYIPISFDTVNINNVFTIKNVAGGVPPYTYSFDDSSTKGNAATLDVELQTGSIFQVIPRVHDTFCRSVTKDGRIITTCNGGNWFADFAAPDVNATEYIDDATGANRGWRIDYSTQLGTGQLEAANNPAGLTWVLNNSYQDNNFIYLGYQSVSPENSAEVSLTPLLPAFVSGKKYTVAFDPYNVRHGAPNTTTTFTMEAVDATTGSVLGSKEYVWNGNTTISLTNEIFHFTGTGHPVTLRARAENDATVTGDWWGSISNVTTTSTTIKKTANNGWNTGVFSATSRNVTDGVNVKFKRDGNSNAGMHGLGADYTGTSYAGGDYLIRANLSS